MDIVLLPSMSLRCKDPLLELLLLPCSPSAGTRSSKYCGSSDGRDNGKSADGTPVTDTEDLQAMLGPDRVGKSVTARLSRGGAAMELPVTVGERPQKEG